MLLSIFNAVNPLKRGVQETGSTSIAQLGQELRAVNAISFCAVGSLLFDSEEYEILNFPSAQNNHRYHDAHSEVYKFLIDGLNLNTLKKLADRLKIPIPPESEKTLKLLGRIVKTSTSSEIMTAFEVVSKNRRLAHHQQRPAAVPMKAFEQFNADMKEVVKAMVILKEHLSQRFCVTVESCIKRREAMTVLHPKFDGELKVQPNYSICAINEVVGKTISKVQIGFREQIEGLHNSELMILDFDDGSCIAIETGSNVSNLMSDQIAFEPADLTISFRLNYVPPLEQLESRSESQEEVE